MTEETLDLAVVGGGISGLVLAREVARRRPAWSVAVLERDERPGGTMRSERVEGCLCEWGPNGFLTNVPYTRDLAVDLGLGERLLPADASASLRFLWVNGALRLLPLKPPEFLRSDLLSRRGRLRVLLEPLQGRAPAGTEDSVHSFAARRIGNEAASVLVDAMVSGVYAGDPSALSLVATFPRMAEMEAAHGSLFRALLAARREARRTGQAAGGPMGPGGILTSFDEGMEVLILRLAEVLGPRLRTGVRVQNVRHDGSGFRLEAESAEGPHMIRARRVALAAPAFANQMMLREGFPEVASCLGEIPYAGITVACLQYARRQVAHPLRGFGFLAPRGQGLRMLGCIWTGSIFPRHVSGDRVLLRAMVGGARDPEGAMLSEGRTVDLVHGELDRILGGINGRPVVTRLYRHAKGIPQYVLGHPERMRLLEERVRRVPGLHLIGNAYRGIGVNDCVREATVLADTLCAGDPAPVSDLAAIGAGPYGGRR